MLLLAAFKDTLVYAKPYSKASLQEAGFSHLNLGDGCPGFCGTDADVCCNGQEVCKTLQGNTATCVGDDDPQDYYTTTWTETRIFTSTIMISWEPAPEPTDGPDCVPMDEDEEPCGPICCAKWQTCAFEGQCSAKSGFSDSPYIADTTSAITSGVLTATSIPVRETQSTDFDSFDADLLEL
jgi:hypothetical protein